MSNETTTHSADDYEAPSFVEYGDLRELTAAENNYGGEDGGTKGQLGSFGGFGNPNSNFS